MYYHDIKKMQRTFVFFLLKPARACYAFILTIFLIISIFFIWAYFAQIDEVIKAPVLLRPHENISSIRCVSSGEVIEKYYVNDKEIKQGDLLFKLDTSTYEMQRKNCDEELKKNLQESFINKVLILTIENSEVPNLNKEIVAYENSVINLNNTKLEAYIKCSAYLDELNHHINLIENKKTKINLEKSKPESLRIPVIIKDLESELSQLQLMFENWKKEKYMQVLEQKKLLDDKAGLLETKIVEIERSIKNCTITAPISGRIYEIKKCNTGDYLLAGEELLRIIPESFNYLIADIYVSPEYIAKFNVGNKVIIKFPGLPPSRYGVITTEVSLIPPDVTYQNGNAFFIVQAEISSPYLTTRNGRTIKLVPGISAEGRVIIDKCSLMQFLLRKLDFIN